MELPLSNSELSASSATNQGQAVTHSSAPKQNTKAPTTAAIKKTGPRVTLGGTPINGKFNLTCYSYTMRQCNNAKIEPDECKPMAKFAATIDVKTGIKQCREILKNKFPEHARLFATKKREAESTQKPNPIQTPTVEEQPQPKPATANTKPEKPEISSKKKKTPAPVTKQKLSKAEKREILQKVYILINQEHKAALTYSESPQTRMRRMEELKQLIAKTKDEELKKAYNSLLRQVTTPSGQMHRGPEGRIQVVGDRSVGTKSPSGQVPEDLRIIQKKMKDAGAPIPSLTPPLEQPVGQGNTTGPAATGTMPEAPGATPVQ